MNISLLKSHWPSFEIMWVTDASHYPHLTRDGTNNAICYDTVRSKVLRESWRHRSAAAASRLKTEPSADGRRDL